jgi:hypothetical protein
VKIAIIAGSLSFLLVIWSVHRAGKVSGEIETSRAQRVQEVEDHYAVTPAERMVPITPSLTLRCHSFPFRTYDGALLTCVFCEELTATTEHSLGNPACAR